MEGYYMKRKILSLLLSFTLCLTLLPMAAFAEEPDKISITTVDELLQFAKVPSRFMRKFICRLRLNEVNRQ